METFIQALIGTLIGSFIGNFIHDIFARKGINARLKALEKNSHPPIDLTPAIKETLIREGYIDKVL